MEKGGIKGREVLGQEEEGEKLACTSINGLIP